MDCAPCRAQRTLHGMTNPNYIQYEGPSDAVMITGTLRAQSGVMAADTQPHVFERVDLISAVSAQLDEHIAMLIGRLHPYYAALPARDDNAARVQQEVASPFENRLQAEADRLMELDGRLVDLLDALRI